MRNSQTMVGNTNLEPLFKLKQTDNSIDISRGKAHLRLFIIQVSLAIHGGYVPDNF